MQALVLAGGEGTRLRPLTLTTPKPVMPLAGRPFLSFMLDWLARHGVDEVLLSLGYRADDVARVLGDIHHGMRLRYVIEDEPLGTAGPLRLAADEGLIDGRVLVLNGDCLTDLDLTAMMARHDETGAAGTIALVPVEDTSSYGVVPTKESGEVEAFLEKQPGPAPTNLINAGTYVLEKSVIDLIPAGRAVSIEREVFPQLVGNGLYGYGFAPDDYWIDIGTPERYLEATYDLLAGRVENELPERDETDSLIYEGCITSGARIGPLSVVGRHCSVGDRSTVERAVLLDDVILGRDCTVTEAVIGTGARVGDGARIEPDVLVGAGATVAAGAVLASGTRVSPDDFVS
ncbi:MAG: mannose-phosphate guanylyltransferase [Thermoleophilaceae bacterium]|jgi:mannose-1-phosphate guanylyltransferase|nr:mannose-phosphate guanylyltransferase [Thermoleophilaceae bacterium]